MKVVEIKNYIKYMITNIIMILFKIFWILPLKRNTILFLSYGGKQYSDSPRYLSEYVTLKYPNKKVVWVINEPNCLSKQDIKCIDEIIKKNTLKFYRYICTIETIVTNDFIDSYIPIRKKQIVLNTWHGGSPTKTVGFKESNSNPYYKYLFRIHDKKYTAIISSSNFFTQEVIYGSFGFKRAEVLKVGLPRTDILLSDHTDIIQKVYDYFSIERNKNIGIVLYAPTFRGNAKNASFLELEAQLPVKQCIEWLNMKFNKKFIFLFRAHHAMNTTSMKESISATDYPDMQELLCAADILITDYSSCMHDFALMKKPVFLYIPDYERYMDNRGFYWDIPTMPFPYAKTLYSFEKIIRDFSYEDYKKCIDIYFDRLGSYERGTAIESTVKWLQSKWR